MIDPVGLPGFAAPNSVLRRLGGYPLAAFQELKLSLVADGGPVADFSIGDPTEPTPEFIRTALLESVAPVSQYPTAAGLGSLRLAIADWVARRFGVTVDPDRHVLPTAGSKEAIFHLPLALVDAHSDRRTVVWGTPGYPVYERGQLLAGGQSHPVTLRAETDWQLDLTTVSDDVLARSTHIWVNYPHNPTGATATLDYLSACRNVAADHGCVMASDECYADIFPSRGAPPPSLLQTAPNPTAPDLTGIIVAFSLSKRSGMTGYRSGALVGDEHLIATQRVLRPNIGTASPTFVQHAAAAAWADDVHVERRRDTFEAKRQVLLDFLNGEGFEVSGSQATFYLWVRAPGGDDQAYAKALLKHRVIVSPGTAFGAGGTGWLRLALVPDVAGCHDAVAAWRAAINDGSLPGHDGASDK